MSNAMMPAYDVAWDTSDCTHAVTLCFVSVNYELARLSVGGRAQPLNTSSWRPGAAALPARAWPCWG